MAECQVKSHQRNITCHVLNKCTTYQIELGFISFMIYEGNIKTSWHAVYTLTPSSCAGFHFLDSLSVFARRPDTEFNSSAIYDLFLPQKGVHVCVDRCLLSTAAIRQYGHCKHCLIVS